MELLSPSFYPHCERQGWWCFGRCGSGGWVRVGVGVGVGVCVCVGVGVVVGSVPQSVYYLFILQHFLKALNVQDSKD